MKGRENKPHIGVFGRKNNGKSSLINAITQQEIAIVSPVPGTTTDPVKKSIEIFGIGPVILIDTAGIDDEGDLGKKRVSKSEEILRIIDLAIIVINEYQWDISENQLVEKLNELETPFIIVNNRVDEWTAERRNSINNFPLINVSAVSGEGIDNLIKGMIAAMPPTSYISHSLLGDVISPNNKILLITPIDSEAPAMRMTLPQVQTLRDILDNDAVATFVKEDKVEYYLQNFPKPDLVITDSQVFNKVSPLVPAEIPLTSFSILLAKHKGDFQNYLKGTPYIDQLQDGDNILVLESCTHQIACEDIGRVKIPNWLQNYTKKKLNFTFLSGLEPIHDITRYALVVQCGGCMVTRKQLLNRLKLAVENNIPITNYGMLIAYINGIFERAVKVFIK